MNTIIQEDLKVKILRKTNSVCPICLDTIAAYIVEKDGSIYMEKTCAIHGRFTILISRYPKDYKELNDFYFYFIPNAIKPEEYYLCATTQCNNNCPICYLKQCPNLVTGTSLDQVKRFSNIKDIKRFTFSHGEATICKNIFEMIEVLKRAHKIVNIHTNGVKIADFQYALALKRAGISQVSIQFDGFDEEVYTELRGKQLLDIKLKALNNLKKLSIPVTLNVTVAKGINEDEIGRIFDYAVNERFIKDISFITYCNYESKQDSMDKYIMPDQLPAYIEKHSKRRILEQDIILFQKLFYAYMNVFRKRKCFNYYHFLIVRTFKSYLPISEFINLHKVASTLDYIKNKKRKLTLLIFLRILLSSLKIESLSLFPYGILIFLRGGYPKKPSMFLAITFATICDPYKYDACIADNCGQGIITDKEIYDSYGAYLMEEIRKQRQSV